VFGFFKPNSNRTTGATRGGLKKVSAPRSGAPIMRVSPPDPRPEGRESRLFFDFLGRELTFFRNSLQGEGRERKKETPCGKGLRSWDT